MRGAWLLLLACGCTAIFDLRAAPNGDRDADGFSDEMDNCPAVYNPDQSNFDFDESGDACDECIATGPDVDEDGIADPCDGCIGNGIDLNNDQIDDNCACVPMGIDVDADGVDDNCDSCTRGPQHDEDGDGVMDACDNCPGIQNATQLNADAVDEVGDACDPNPGSTARTFDNFMTENSLWFQLGAGWSRVNGSYFFDAKADTYRALGTTNAKLRVIAGVRFGLPGSGTTQFEVFSTNSIVPPRAFDVRCTLTDTGELTGQLVQPGVLGGGAPQPLVGDLDVSGHLVVMLDVDPKSGSAKCTARDRADRMIEVPLTGTISESNFPGIGGTGSAEVTFYDLLIYQ